MRLYVNLKRGGGFGHSRRQSHNVQEIPQFVTHQPKLLVTWSPSQLPVCPLRGTGFLQSSLHPLQGVSWGSSSSVETSLVHVLDSGQSTVFLSHCLAHVVLTVSEGQNSTEGETFVLSSYSLTFPRLSVSTKAGHTGLVSEGCSDVQG